MKKILSIMMYAALIFSFSNNNLFAQIQLLDSFEGMQAQKIFVPNDSRKMDFNGDGIPELPLMEEEGIFYYLKIIDGTDPDKNWQIPLPNGIIAILIGFQDMDGTVNPSNQKEIIMATKMGNRYINPIVISSNDGYDTVEIKSFVNSVVVAAGDINGDGQAEIAVFDPAAKEVQIWGY